MKLLEFFSKNNSEDSDAQLESDLEKDVMGFLLDDDDFYKEHLHSFVSKISKGKKVDPKDLLDAISKGCLKFYKEKELKKDPNKLFPISMRKRMAQNFIKINSEGSKKDEDPRTTD